jgi:hypothetical protein
MPCSELTKAAGWKSGCSCDPLRNFRANAPAPLEKFAHAPKKSFATQSLTKLPRRPFAIEAVAGQYRKSPLGISRDGLGKRPIATINYRIAKGSFACRWRPRQEDKEHQRATPESRARARPTLVSIDPGSHDHPSRDGWLSRFSTRMAQPIRPATRMMPTTPMHH